MVRSTPLGSLTPAIREEMWKLYSASYSEVSRENFDRDLALKTGVFVGTDTGDGSFQGFSTFEFYPFEYGGRELHVLFSGDTMIAPAYWGQPALHLAFLREVVFWKLRHPFGRLYWYLICMGYRTYLIMAKNLQGSYWPTFAEATPTWEAGLIDALSRARYGAAWDPVRGLIDLPVCEARLAEHVAPITERELRLPEVRFLVEKNPTYTRGTEMACVGYFSWALPFRFLLKRIRKSLVPKQRYLQPIATIRRFRHDLKLRKPRLRRPHHRHGHAPEARAYAPKR